MENLNKKPFEEYEMTLIPLSDDIITTSFWVSEGGTEYGEKEDGLD